MHCVVLVLGEAVVVTAIGILLGRIAAPPDAFASNSQVSSHISPRLIDLLAASATGTVGAPDFVHHQQGPQALLGHQPRASSASLSKLTASYASTQSRARTTGSSRPTTQTAAVAAPRDPDAFESRREPVPPGPPVLCPADRPVVGLELPWRLRQYVTGLEQCLEVGEHAGPTLADGPPFVHARQPAMHPATWQRRPRPSWEATGPNLPPRSVHYVRLEVFGVRPLLSGG
ncbi:hypothetical protein ACFWFU_14860 [Streptomyces sp. NPDC060235]|uniref:hypothetical protein n=1 Tax=Streptomyces sp. NPDC060235 TaxID=3347080 RepID=UPI0036489535